MRRLGVLLVSVLFLASSLLAAVAAENEIAARFSQAQDLVQQGQSERAIQAYQSIIDTNPDIPEAYNNLAAIYLKQKKIKLAKSVLEQGLTAHKGYGALYEGLSAINIALAKEAYSKALQIDLKPDDIVIADLSLSASSLKQSKNVFVVSAVTAKEHHKPEKILASKSIATNANEYAVKQPAVKQAANKEIEILLKAWSAAWSAQAVDIYLSFYHPQYLPANNVAKDAWEKSRQLRLKKPKWIKVSLSDIEIKTQSDNQATVMFKQTYRSNSFRDVSFKQMVLRNTDTGWQIFREKSL